MGYGERSRSGDSQKNDWHGSDCGLPGHLPGLQSLIALVILVYARWLLLATIAAKGAAFWDGSYWPAQLAMLLTLCLQPLAD